MKSDHQLRVEQFMHRAEELAPGLQQVPDQPTMPSVEVRMLRARLIYEEAIEAIFALGFEIVVTVKGNPLNPDITMRFEPVADAELTLAEIAKECADLSVVTTGTLSACGLPDKPILEAVDQNNLEKFGPGASVNEHGKLTKPPGHKPPDLGEVIRKMGEG